MCLEKKYFKSAWRKLNNYALSIEADWYTINKLILLRHTKTNLLLMWYDLRRKTILICKNIFPACINSIRKTGKKYFEMRGRTMSWTVKGVLSSWRTAFDPGPFHMIFVIKLLLGSCIPTSVLASPCQNHSISNPYTHFITLPQTVHNLSKWQCL
jgi:hypothetical protein